METIALNPATDREEFKHNFNKVIGSGHLGLALYEPTIRHLEMAHRDLGIQYLRCHGLLSGSPDLCSWAIQSKAVDPGLRVDGPATAGRVDAHLDEARYQDLGVED